MWTSKNTFTFSGLVKNKEGVPKYELTGRYTDKIKCTDLETGESFIIFEAPEI
jgi:hypothetical protein